MRTIKTNVYTFDELDDRAKECAREWWRLGNDYPFLSEAMEQYATDLLLENKIEADPDSLKVYYSLNYCQGDGAMLEFSGEWSGYTVTVKQYGHYVHEYSTTIEIYKEDDSGYREYEDYTDFQERVYVPMCQKLRDYGYRYIDAENEDEYVDENIMNNEYEFTSDGKIA